jgi:hypothetical protein
LNGYGAEKSRFRASVLEVNGYQPEKCRFNVHNVHFSFFFRMNGHQKRAFSCLIGALNSPRKVNGYGADYAHAIDVFKSLGFLPLDLQITFS